MYTVKVEFTDSDGDSDSVSWTVYVNRPPSVARVSPSTSSINLVVGDSQTFSARATDADSNISEWEWFVDDVLKGGRSLSFTGDITRQFSHTFSSAGTYTVEVEFIDDLLESDSVSWTVEADEDLEQVSVTVASNTSGRTVTVDGTDRAAPYAATWDSGSSHTLNVPSPQNISGVNSRYVYSSWSQGGSQSQTVAPTSDATYTANFTQQHFLSTRSTPTGPGVTGGGQWYDHNSTAFVGPAPTVAGYNFSYWRKDYQNIGTDPAGVSVTVDGPTLVEAVFTPAVTAPPSVSRVSPSSSEVNLDPGDSQTFSARATDADNNISQWEWFLDGVSKGGQSLTLSGDITRQFSHTFSTADVYTVKVEFTDSEGESGSVSWDVYVNRPPSVARVSPSTSSINLVVGDSQTFSARATDADSNISEWEWFVDDVLKGGRSLSFTGDISDMDITRQFSHTFSSAGTYTVEVEFIDDLLESDSVSWTVRAGNTAPTIRSLDYSSDPPLAVLSGDTQTFRVYAVDRESNISEWEWFVDEVSKGGQSVSLTEIITRKFNYTFSTAGTYEVKVTVTDNAGASTSETLDVTVTDNVAPSASIDSPPSPVILDPGDYQLFSASATDPDYNLAKVEFFLNGQLETTRSYRGNTAIGFFSQHFDDDGIYTVKAVFTDEKGASDSVSWTVRVKITVLFTSSPDPTRTITVDGVDNTAWFSFDWDPGSSHTISVRSPQSVEGVSSQYAFSSWSHGGSQSQTVAPTSDTTYTANFTFQHFLSTRTEPRGIGIAGGGQWYDHRSTATVGPAPKISGYNFSHWSKDKSRISGRADPESVSVEVYAPTLVEAVYVVNVPPEAAGFPEESSISLKTGDSYQFQGACEEKDPTSLPRRDASLVRVEWSFNGTVEDETVFTSPSYFSIHAFSHTFSTSGSHTVKFTCYDGGGGSDSVTWTVTATGSPPITGTVSVTVASNPSGRTVTVDGTNRTAPYTASWNSGSSHTLNVPSPQNITGVSSRYAFSRWSHGGSRSQTVSPTSNSTYTANFTLQHFLSTRSTPTGPGVAGGGQWYNHSSTAFVGPAPTVAGYNFSYWRKDFQNIGTDPAGVSVTVDGPTLVEAVFTPAGENRAPTIADDFSPSTESIILFAGRSQTFEARATDPDNNISSVVWHVDDLVVWDPGSIASIALTGDFPSSYDHTFSAPDTHTVKVTFTDAEGATASHSWTVQVDPPNEERAPTVERIAPEESELSLYTTQTQDFTVEATDVNGDIAKWKWVVDKAGVLTDGHEEEEEFDEETGSITKEFSHPFDDDGTYTVTVTFTDSEGESGSLEWEVEVEDGPDLAVEDLGIRTTSNPAELGGSIEVEVKLQNHSDTDGGAFELPFYFKNTGLRFIRLIDLERALVTDVDISLTSQLHSGYSDRPLGAGETRSLHYTVRIPGDIRAGPFWICVQIEHKESTTDPIPDPKAKNNADCTLTYVLSSPEIASWIYPVAPVEDYVGRFWFGIPRTLFNPTRTKESIYDRYATPEYGLSAESYFDSDTRVELYRDIALELAARKALIETEGHLAIVGLRKKHIDERKEANTIVSTILSLYKPIHDVVKGSSNLLSFAGMVLEFFNVLAEGFDLYMAILINRSINIDKALDTLEVLENLNIDNEYDGKASEWRLGVSKARADVLKMASEKFWERAIFAAKELVVELIASGVKLVLGALGKAGIVVKGIALGSAKVGAVIFAMFAILNALAAYDDHWDNLLVSLMATQVYAELYDENASGDHLEVLTYAKYVAYDRAYRSEDNWLTTVSSILRGGLDNANQFKEEADAFRMAALEEARAVIQVAEIEFDPSHYFLKIGEELKLAPEFRSVSGNKMIGFGVEWTNDAGVNEAVELDVDTQVVTGRAPGDATVVANIGDVRGSVTFTVIGDSVCSNGAVADATNLGLLDDCEALLVARDTLAGSSSLNWSETTPITQWDGVSLGGTPRRVTRLNLAGKGLSGTIPSVLGRLSMLTQLNLRSNDGLTGEIPSELGYLSNLKVLNLHSNTHSGSIPDLSGMTSLEELYLANNDLTGSIPTWLNGMTNMRQLWLWGNSLSGSIPDLSGMTSLDKLKLANNMLTGGVPDGSMLPPNMTWLIIDGNPLGGEIPDLSGLTSLKLLWLHSNGLTGSIPSGDMLPPNVDDLNLRDNMLTGEIPDLSRLDRATRVRLHGNDLSGRVPATLGDLSMLRQLWLWDNELTSIADGLGDLADTLIEIGLNGNPWDAVACVPAALANVAKNDYTEAGIEVCSADDGS